MKVRARIRDIVKTGGPTVAGSQEGTATKAFNLFTGKTDIGEIRKQEEETARQRELQAQVAQQVAAEEAQGRDDLRMPAANMPPAPPMAQMPPPPPQGGLEVVVAEFDCVAEAGDELSFKVTSSRRESQGQWDHRMRASLINSFFAPIPDWRSNPTAGEC